MKPEMVKATFVAKPGKTKVAIKAAGKKMK